MMGGHRKGTTSSFSVEERLFVSLANRVTRRSFVNSIAKGVLVLSATSVADLLFNDEASAAISCCSSQIDSGYPQTVFCACVRSDGQNACPTGAPDWCTGGYWHTCSILAEGTRCSGSAKRVYRDCGGNVNSTCGGGCTTITTSCKNAVCGTGETNRSLCCNSGYNFGPNPLSGCNDGSTCNGSASYKNFCVACDCCSNKTC